MAQLLARLWRIYNIWNMRKLSYLQDLLFFSYFSTYLLFFMRIGFEKSISVIEYIPSFIWYGDRTSTNWKILFSFFVKGILIGILYNLLSEISYTVFGGSSFFSMREPFTKERIECLLFSWLVCPKRSSTQSLDLFSI